MSLSAALQAVLRRWYITIPGVLLSLLIASTTFNLIPPRYTSSGTAVLVQQKSPTAANLENPVLGGSGSLDIATITLVQALGTPAIKEELGLTRRGDNLTINNVGAAAVAEGADHPFLYITAQTSSPQKSVEIVDDVMGMARQKLADIQAAVHVTPERQIKLETVVDATRPKAVVTTSYAVTGAALMLAIIVTCVVACTWDRIVLAQQKRRIRRSASPAKKNAAPHLGTIPLRLN